DRSTADRRRPWRPSDSQRSYRGDTEILRELEKMAASRLVFFWILIVLRTAAGFLQEEEEGEPDLNETVLCSNDQMKVVIPSIFFLRKDPPVFVGDLHLNDPECRGVEVGEDYVFSIKTNLSDCGTIMVSDQSHIMFTNSIHNNESQVISRNYIPVRYLVQQPGGGHGEASHRHSFTETHHHPRFGEAFSQLPQQPVELLLPGVTVDLIRVSDAESVLRRQLFKNLHPTLSVSFLQTQDVGPVVALHDVDQRPRLQRVGGNDPQEVLEQRLVAQIDARGRVGDLRDVEQLKKSRINSILCSNATDECQHESLISHPSEMLGSRFGSALIRSKA
ncbi:hypothetical protein F7725_008760, partial [Dissostichus mawsoni]